MLIPTALLIACAAAFSATDDPYAYLFAPEFGYAQTALPFFMAGFAFAPVIAAREAAQLDSSPVAVAAASQITLLIGCAAAIWWLGVRMSSRAAVKP